MVKCEVRERKEYVLVVRQSWIGLAVCFDVERERFRPVQRTESAVAIVFTIERERDGSSIYTVCTGGGLNSAGSSFVQNINSMFVVLGPFNSYSYDQTSLVDAGGGILRVAAELETGAAGRSGTWPPLRGKPGTSIGGTNGDTF